MSKSKSYREKLEKTMDSIRKNNPEPTIQNDSVSQNDFVNRDNTNIIDTNANPDTSGVEDNIPNNQTLPEKIYEEKDQSSVVVSESENSNLSNELELEGTNATLSEENKTAATLSEEIKTTEQNSLENNNLSNQPNNKNVEHEAPDVKQKEEPVALNSENPQATDGSSSNASDTNLAVITPTLKELQEKNFTGLSLTDIMNCFSNEIEQAILQRGSERDVLDFEEGVSKKWEELFEKKSYPAMPEIHQIIDIITKRTPLKKYQVFERLILNGLKYTKFTK